MNQMGMAGMNAMGGPVGGMPMMNNTVGPGPSQTNGNPPDSLRKLLNTYIYDYFLKNELYGCADAFLKSNVPINFPDQTKLSPGRRREGDVNGVDDSSMETDSKDDLHSKAADKLPIPNVPSDCPDNSFLFDWWCLFWDIYSAQRSKKPKPGDAGPALQYVQHTQVILDALGCRRESDTLLAASIAHTPGSTTAISSTHEPPDDARTDEPISDVHEKHAGQRDEHEPKRYEA